MKKLLAVLLLGLAVQAQAAPYFQHASLAPSNVQGELFTGVVHTNAGMGQITALPLFWNNAAPDAPWYRPSFAPLVVGGSSGGGNVQGVAGSVLDVGPQIIAGIESIVGAFSPNAKASTVAFFNCSSSATACASISAGAFFNVNLEEGGRFSTSTHDLLRHPFAQFIGPSLHFGGPGAK